MSQTSPAFAQATPDASQKADPACESIFSNLSPNASRLLAALLSIKRNRLPKEIMLGMGYMLNDHGVFENRFGGLISAVDELKEKGMIEYPTGCEYGEGLVRDGIKLDGAHVCLGADDMFRWGCVTLYTVASVIFGERDEKLEDARAKCVEAAKGVVNIVDPNGKEVIGNILSAAVVEISRGFDAVSHKADEDK